MVAGGVFDRPRCILCIDAVRVCGEGWMFGPSACQNRGVSSIIAPNKEIIWSAKSRDVHRYFARWGQLTSGAYRYRRRAVEMKHVGTICTHLRRTVAKRRWACGAPRRHGNCSGDNRDKSGTNGDFLCIKGRYAFDFAKS